MSNYYAEVYDLFVLFFSCTQILLTWACTQQKKLRADDKVVLCSGNFGESDESLTSKFRTDWTWSRKTRQSISCYWPIRATGQWDFQP